MEGRAGYRLRIKGPGIEVDQAVTGTQVIEILARVLRGGESNEDEFVRGILEDDARAELAAELSPEGRALRRAIYDRDGAKRLRLYLQALPTRTNDEKIAAFTLYAAKEGHPRHVSRESLPNFFHAAGFPIPRNLMRDVRKAIDKGWVEEHPEGSGLFRITDSGTAHLTGGE